MFEDLIKNYYINLPIHQRKKCLKLYRCFKYFRNGWLIKNSVVSLIRPFVMKKKIRNINRFEQSFYSQNGEDGIIKAIFDKIGITNKFCVEFGVETGIECNTRHLIEKKKWKFLHMDCGENMSPSIKNEKITAENINALFKKYKVPRKFDLLSIDIDFNDYWVWKALNSYSPRVVIIEYNSSIPLLESKTVKYDPNKFWDGSNYFGASLLALKKLGESKGYTLIGCDNCGVNSFFIRSDLIKNNFEINDIEKIYRPPGYGMKIHGKFIGHRPSNKMMISV